MILILLSATFFSSTAQTRISSPYSYYGLGELQSNHSAYSSAMGGIKNGLRNPAFINYDNPASYSAFDTNTFIFDLGVISNFNQLQSNVITQAFTNHTSVGYLLFGFPVTHWCGLSLGVIPYSKTGYQIISRDTLATIGSVLEKFDGTGGISKAYIGTSFRLFKHLSLGVNLGYLFGSTYKNRSVYLPDQSYSFNIKTTNDLRVSSFYLDYGLQYQFDLKKNYALVLGTKFNLPMSIHAKRSQLAETFTENNDVQSIKDTLINIDEESGKIKMPLTIGGGITFMKKNMWMVGADFDWQNWKKFESFGIKDSIDNSFNFAIGGEYTPRYTSLKNYWKKMSYRFGFHYGQSNLELRNTKIDDFSVSLGIGFPIKRIRTVINLAVEAGKKGTINQNLIQENYVKFTLGFSFREFWFFRPKLN
ncbi:MAG: hypothetical protein WCQ95_01695 [Bacteroidota bacterium]